MSADGLVVAGISTADSELADAFRWTQSGTLVISRSEYSSVSIKGLSANGAVMVGDVTDRDRRYAARWNAAGQIELLPDPVGATASEAAAVSADGTHIAGTVWFGLRSQAVRWSPDGMKVLGEPGFISSRGISADGTRVIGEAVDGSVVWDEIHGTRKVSAIFAASGVSTAGWNLTYAIAISGDGKYVLGSARYTGPDHPNQELQRPFLLRLP